MRGKPEGDDKDPAPFRHSDAERVSGDQSEGTVNSESVPEDSEDD